MGLDERRSKFKLSRFQYRDSTNSGWKLAAVHDTPRRKMRDLHNKPNGQAARKFSANLGANDTLTNGNQSETLESGEPDMRAAPTTAETDTLEVWFTGCHADVGGGAVKNEVRHKLSQIPLRWMIRQCFECDTGIIFNTHRLAEEGLDVHTLWPKYHRLGRPTEAPPKHLKDQYEAGEIGPISRRATALEDHGANDNDNRNGGVYKLKIWEDDEKEQLNENWVSPKHVSSSGSGLTLFPGSRASRRLLRCNFAPERPACGCKGLVGAGIVADQSQDPTCRQRYLGQESPDESWPSPTGPGDESEPALDSSAPDRREGVPGQDQE